MQNYLLGIDLGNTKAEYLMCTLDGEFVGIYSADSYICDDYEKMISDLKKQLIILLEQCDISFDNVVAVGIGIARMYTADQITKIEAILRKSIGVNKIVLSTDTSHGTYSYWLGRGTGLYSFASTGDITMGRSLDSKWVITGGMGIYNTEEASGTYIYKKAIGLLYDYYYRCGKDSIIFPDLISLLGLETNDIRKSLKSITSDHLKEKGKNILMILDDGALTGDKVATNLFKEAGVNSGKSSAGCIKNMKFKEEITNENPIKLMLIGSIWNKIINNEMRDAYFKTVLDLSGKACIMNIPEAPPVVGCILKAKEVIDNGVRVSEEYRTKVLESTALKSTEADIISLQNDEFPKLELLRYLIIVKKNKPQTTVKLGIDEQICKITKKHPMLKDVSAELVSVLFPAICSILRKNYFKAFNQIALASKHIKIEQKDIETYNQLVIECSKKSKNKEYYIQFFK